MDRTVLIPREHGLTIDHAQVDAIDTVLDGCTFTEMVVLVPTTTETSTATATTTPTTAPTEDALGTYDEQRNLVCVGRQPMDYIGADSEGCYYCLCSSEGCPLRDKVDRSRYYDTKHSKSPKTSCCVSWE